jgi:hypothetical protein
VTCGRRVRWQGEVNSAGREGRDREAPLVVGIGAVPRRGPYGGGRRKGESDRAWRREQAARVRAPPPPLALFLRYGPASRPGKWTRILCRPRTKIPPTRELLYFVPQPFSRVVPSASKSLPFFPHRATRFVYASGIRGTYATLFLMKCSHAPANHSTILFPRAHDPL